jgi:hypothetical protein
MTTTPAPFRPNAADLARIGGDVAPMAAIQQKLVANHPHLGVPDRVAHQYQIAGGKVSLRIETSLPVNFAGVGLFTPGAQYTGVGRISTGLGCPHLETDPDFIGLMAAFQTSGGQRVDFLGINDPASPTDTHAMFMKLLDATADAAGVEAPFGSGFGELDLTDLAASNLRVIRSLVASLGPIAGLKVASHVAKQTLRTAISSTAYQTFWTGIVEVGGASGKFMFAPASDENGRRALTPGARYLTGEWRARQARGDIHFTLHWLPFIGDASTSMTELTKPWVQRPTAVGQLTFPKTDGDADAPLWAALAAELGANPGNWVADAGNSIAEPGTEFGCARKLAYRNSQAGRNALPEAEYAHVFTGAPIGATLAAELKRRRAAKEAGGHVDVAP